MNISVWQWYGLRHSITFLRILFCLFCCKCICIVDQMLQNSMKQFYEFNKRTILIQRIIYTFNKRTNLIQWIICAFNWVTILIQRIIYTFKEIIIFIQRNIYIFNERIILIQQIIDVFNGELIVFYMFNDSEIFFAILCRNCAKILNLVSRIFWEMFSQEYATKTKNFAESGFYYMIYKSH